MKRFVPFALTLSSCVSAPTAEDAKIHYRQGYQYLNMGEVAKAKEEFSKAIKIDTTFAEAYCRLGYIYAAEGNHVDAMVNYRRAISFNPSYADAHYYFALSLLASEDTAKALEEFHAAVQADSNHILAREALGSFLLSAGRYEDAYPHYQALARLKYQDLNVQYTFAVLGYYSGHYSEALIPAQRVVAADDNNPEAHLLLGSILVQLGRYGEAGLELQKAAEQFNARGDNENAAKAKGILDKIKNK
ncbi:MAG: tetratricopeptide repeat protein [candidate division WOR-3 bacterium]